MAILREMDETTARANDPIEFDLLIESMRWLA